MTDNNIRDWDWCPDCQCLSLKASICHNTKCFQPSRSKKDLSLPKETDGAGWDTPDGCAKCYAGILCVTKDGKNIVCTNEKCDYKRSAAVFTAEKSAEPVNGSDCPLCGWFLYAVGMDRMACTGPKCNYTY